GAGGTLHGAAGFGFEFVQVAPGGAGVSNDGAQSCFVLDDGELCGVVKAFVAGEAAHVGGAFLRFAAVDFLHEFDGVDDARGEVLRVAGVAMTHSGGDDGSAFQVHDVLRLVNHVAGTVFGAAHFGVGVVRVIPFFV